MAHEIATEENRIKRQILWRGLVARALETIIGSILLIAGLLKAWEPLSFISKWSCFKNDADHFGRSSQADESRLKTGSVKPNIIFEARPPIAHTTDRSVMSNQVACEIAGR